MPACHSSSSEAWRSWLMGTDVRRRTSVLNFHSDAHRDTPVDIFVSEPFDFGTEFQLALVQEIAPGVPMRIVQLETLLRMKADVGRPQDIADIAELRRIHEEG